MSRSLERALGPAGTNTFVTVLTVPTGHKYEIVALSASEATGQAGAYYLLVLIGGTAGIFVDEFAYPAGKFVQRRPLYDLVLYAGDVLQSGAIAGGGTSWSQWVDYVDVDYSS